MEEFVDFSLVDLSELRDALPLSVSAYDGCSVNKNKGQCGTGCGCGVKYGECGGWVKPNRL